MHFGSIELKIGFLPIFATKMQAVLSLRFVRRGKSGQHRASRFLTGRGLGLNTRAMESAAENTPPMAERYR